MAFKIYASNFASVESLTRDANIQKQSQRIHLFEKAFPHLGQVFHLEHLGSDQQTNTIQSPLLFYSAASMIRGRLPLILSGDTRWSCFPRIGSDPGFYAFLNGRRREIWRRGCFATRQAEYLTTSTHKWSGHNRVQRGQVMGTGQVLEAFAQTQMLWASPSRRPPWHGGECFEHV